jgi:hypothetical protein
LKLRAPGGERRHSRRSWIKGQTILFGPAVVCFAPAYRFASHGITRHDNGCIGLGCVAFAVGGVLLWAAFRNRVAKRG